tara:strand:- start:12 stop:323 length:312 start_codon:yes stop_codon:yes gene_type:complete
MTLVARENVFNPGFTHDYNPRNEEIRKAGRIWDILAQKYPEQKERIDRIRRTSGPMLGPEQRDPGPIFGPEKSEKWPGNVQTLPYVPDGRHWRDKIQTLPYRY